MKRAGARWAVIAFVLGGWCGSRGWAETYVWVGTNRALWGVPENWVPATGYPQSGDTAWFTNSSGVVNLGGDQVAYGVFFTNQTSFTLSNGTLTVGAGGVALQRGVSASPTFRVPVRLATNAAIVNREGGGGRDLNFNATIDNDRWTLSLAPAGASIYCNGGITGAGMVWISDDAASAGSGGYVYLRGTNSFTGRLEVNCVHGRQAIIGADGFLQGCTGILVCGGQLLLGDTSSNLPDNGETTHGRVRRDVPIALRGNRALKLIGRNGSNTVERLGPVTYHMERASLGVVHGTGAVAELYLASLVRDAESRPLAIVQSDNYTLGGSSRLLLDDGGIGLVQWGGTGSRTTDKPIVHGMFSSTAPTYTRSVQSYVNTLVRYDPVNGFVPLVPLVDFVNAVDTNFPSVHPDGNDNVRLPWTAVMPYDSNTVVMLPSDTTINSLVFFDDKTSTCPRRVTLSGPTGATLTIKSGMLMTAASPAAERWVVTINVSTLSFGHAEGVWLANWTHYGDLTVNSALVGTNGLTITTFTADDEGQVHLYGDNRNLRGPITIAGGFENTAKCLVYHWNALGSGSNDVFLANSILKPWNFTNSIRSLAGQGLVRREWNATAGRLRIGYGTNAVSDKMVRLQPGGAIRPGNSVFSGTLTFARFSQLRLDGGRVEMDLFSPTVYDRVVLTNETSADFPTVTISNACSLALNVRYTPTVGDTFLLFFVSQTNLIVGQFAEGNVLETVCPGGRCTFDLLYNSDLGGGSGNDLVARCREVRRSGMGTLFMLR